MLTKQKPHPAMPPGNVCEETSETTAGASDEQTPAAPNAVGAEGAAADSRQSAAGWPTGRRPRLAVRTLVVLLVLAILSAGAAGVYRWTHQGKGDPADPSAAASAEPAAQVPVVVTPSRKMLFEEKVVISGNVAAKNEALVSARIPGVLDAIYVDEGDAVEAGKTRLFQTDSLKLTKAVAVARQALEVAECSLAETRARLEQVLAEKDQAERDLARYRELVRQNAVPVQMLERQETGYRAAVAAVKDVEALVALRQAQLEQARLSLAIAEKDLADSLVLAPISGRVSRRFKEPGEMAGAGEPVLKIDDLSVLEVSVFVPAEYYARITTGRTQMRVEINGIDLGTRVVSYKSPTVNPRLRTFEVRSLVESPPAGVAPGCLAEVAVLLEQHEGLGVPSEAIVERGGKSVVFVVQDGKARMVPVKPGGEMDGWREVAEGDLAPGAAVISQGQDLVEQGTPVSVVE